MAYGGSLLFLGIPYSFHKKNSLLTASMCHSLGSLCRKHGAFGLEVNHRPPLSLAQLLHRLCLWSHRHKRMCLLSSSPTGFWIPELGGLPGPLQMQVGRGWVDRQIDGWWVGRWTRRWMHQVCYFKRILTQICLFVFYLFYLDLFGLCPFYQSEPC